jgi:hypothetical protein
LVLFMALSFRGVLTFLHRQPGCPRCDTRKPCTLDAPE